MPHNPTNNHPPEEPPDQVETPHGLLVHADSLLPYWPDDSTFSINLLHHEVTGQPWLEIEWEGHGQVETIRVPLSLDISARNFEDLPRMGYGSEGVGREEAA